MPSYELMFIVKPELDEEQVTAATDRVHQMVVSNGGAVTKTAAWGKRRLAYQVGPYKEGYYVVSNFDVEPDRIAELERVLKISDSVFRHLLVKRDKSVNGQHEVVVPELADGEDLGAIRPEIEAPAAAGAEDEFATTEAPAAIDEADAAQFEEAPPASDEEVEA
ncbi:MAG: 30S ribosomal protein S6 [Candidatus Dormibacteria bacterium]